MTDLDDLEALKQLDSEDFLSHLEGFPEQVAFGRDLGNAAAGLPEGRQVKGIAVLGMGGSGFSGDILKAIVEPQSAVFVSSIKGYDLPKWVGPGTVVFAVSYSGTTEETLATMPEAIKRGATIVVLSSGGSLSEMAPAEATVVQVPSGLAPRAAIGYLVMPMLVICERLGLCHVKSAVSETIELLEQRREECRRETPTDRNPAKQLASTLVGTVPIVYGSEGVGQAAAYRWKCQFNECSKVLSFSNAFPELDHNELECWDRPAPSDTPVSLIALRHGGDTGRRGGRIDITLSMIEQHVRTVKQITARGESPLARLFDLMYLGDFTAAYLGLAQGADPGRIRAIPALKAQMDQSHQ